MGRRCATDWVQLCERFPRDVTAQVRDDWRLVTSTAARWLIPDWAQAAQQQENLRPIDACQ